MPSTAQIVGNNNGGVVATGAVDLNGFNQTVSGLNSIARVTNNNATASRPSTLTLNLGSTTINDVGGTVSNGATNTVALVVNGTNGSSVQSIGVTTFTGGTTINGGTLLINGNNSATAAMAAGANTLSNPYAAANNLTLAGGTFQLLGQEQPLDLQPIQPGPYHGLDLHCPDQQ